MFSDEQYFALKTFFLDEFSLLTNNFLTNFLFYQTFLWTKQNLAQNWSDQICWTNILFGKFYLLP